MQSYNAPLNDMKFILEDFLNSGASDTLFKQNDLELDDFNFILEESLGGGGTETLITDAQGKVHGLALLHMVVQIDESLLSTIKHD